MTHDYVRRGTTTLFVALNVLDDGISGNSNALLSVLKTAKGSKPFVDSNPTSFKK
jgi:hypothetical protein